MASEDLHDDDSKELREFEAGVLAQLDPNADPHPATFMPEATPTEEGEPEESGQPQEPAEKPVSAEPKQPTPQPEKGDLRAALRASRFAEKRAREEAQRLRDELDAARQGQPAKTAQADATDVLATLEVDQPEVATVFKRLIDKVERLESAVPRQAQQEAQPEFIPETLPLEVQSAVDEVPELLQMQLDPNQERWQIAKRMDAFLVAHPKWKDASVTDRLAEVARRVALEVPSNQPPTDPKEVARQRIAQAKGRTPETLSDLRGGRPPAQTSRDYSQMTDDEVMASLR